MSSNYIGTIIKGSNYVKQINSKVAFKVNGEIYEKKLKEKNKIRREKYIESESINIICNDLNDDEVIVDSDIVGYYNKVLLVLLVVIAFSSILLTIILSAKDGSFNFLGVIGFACSMILLLIYTFYVYLMQPKKIYQKYTAVCEGEIIDYKRTDISFDKDDMKHCDYNIIYKFIDKDGNIIHSSVSRYSAKYLYKDYPLHKKVMVRYNPNKSSESCLQDEYDSIFNNKQFVNNSFVGVMAIAKVTNIIPKCIDEDVDDDMKKYFISDNIECEYMIGDVTYKSYSIFTVNHDRFNIGDEIIIYYNNENKNEFFCDLKSKYSNMDKI